MIVSSNLVIIGSGDVGTVEISVPCDDFQLRACSVTQQGSYDINWYINSIQLVTRGYEPRTGASLPQDENGVTELLSGACHWRDLIALFPKLHCPALDEGDRIVVQASNQSAGVGVFRIAFVGTT